MKKLAPRIMRILAWILVRMMYRLKTNGIENIPEKGSAVLICNHVSFADWLVISGAIKRPIRFVMYYKFAQIPVLKWLLKMAQVIPVAGIKEDEALFKAAFDKVSEELKAGELVCIFPEGSISRDGHLGPFKNGILHIIKRDPVPVIPMALGNLWGSFFSFKGGTAMGKLPRRFWSPVSLKVSAPIAPNQVRVEELQRVVETLLE